jgi:hypothetical protein
MWMGKQESLDTKFTHFLKQKQKIGLLGFRGDQVGHLVVHLPTALYGRHRPHRLEPEASPVYHYSSPAGVHHKGPRSRGEGSERARRGQLA